jgi:hypothetical protein
MNTKKEYRIELSEQDIYWLKQLLKDYIESEANINQIEDCFPLYKELESLKKITKNKEKTK